MSNCFTCRKNYKGQKGFDKYYIEKIVVPTVVKTGEGEHDFIIKNKIITEKHDIKEQINSQADTCGIDYYMRCLDANGIDPVAPTITDGINDFTGCPENIADAIALGKKSINTFKKLDPKLTKGQSYEDFVSNFSQKDLNDYLASLMKAKDIKDEKKEVKENE